MRSKLFSIALAVLALTTGAMAFLHLTQKNLSALFGEPPTSSGQRLFNFHPSEVRKIAIDSLGKPQRYEERQGQWLLNQETTPDRADYRVLEALLAFSADLTILESLPATDQNLKAVGLSPARAHLQFKDGSGKSIADFSVGKKGAWHRHTPAPDPYSKAQDWPSVYLRLRDSKHIYLCSSPYLEDILLNGFGEHRDLRPFFFPPELLAEISIMRPNGNLVLARETPAATWRIEKPFKLDADPVAAAELIGGLYNLTALKADNKPAPPASEPALQLALRFFGLDGMIQETPITLSLTESQKNETNAYLGRLDDWRKNIAFQIPRSSLSAFKVESLKSFDSDKDGTLNPEETQAALLARFDKNNDGALDETENTAIKTATNRVVGLDELPLTIERLRGASLSGLDLRQLKKLQIQSPDLDTPLDIEIGKSPISGDWRIQRTYAGKTSPANELTFFTVKKILTEEKATATVSDAVDSLSQYGLDSPALTLTLELFDGTQENIFFGEKISSEGVPQFFFRRNESRTVMQIDSAVYYRIAARPYLWRDARVWNFNIVDLNLLLIERGNEPPLTLDYSDLAQTWSARQGNADVTALLNENRANRYLENLEALSADRWLGPDNPPAQQALQSPIFKLTALFQRPDNESAPIETQTLRLAGASRQGSNPFYYGQIEGDPHYFILELETVAKLAEKLLEAE
ncbi:MAG: DUF4340 domain-containing protein [Roseibacillus sp.]